MRLGRRRAASRIGPRQHDAVVDRSAPRRRATAGTPAPRARPGSRPRPRRCPRSRPRRTPARCRRAARRASNVPAMPTSTHARRPQAREELAPCAPRPRRAEAAQRARAPGPASKPPWSSRRRRSSAVGTRTSVGEPWQPDMYRQCRVHGRRVQPAGTGSGYPRAHAPTPTRAPAVPRTAPGRRRERRVPITERAREVGLRRDPSPSRSRARRCTGRRAAAHARAADHRPREARQPGDADGAHDREGAPQAPDRLEGLRQGRAVGAGALPLVRPRSAPREVGRLQDRVRPRRAARPDPRERDGRSAGRAADVRDDGLDRRHAGQGARPRGARAAHRGRARRSSIPRRTSPRPGSCRRRRRKARSSGASCARRTRRPGSWVSCAAAPRAAS